MQGARSTENLQGLRGAAAREAHALRYDPVLRANATSLAFAGKGGSSRFKTALGPVIQQPGFDGA
jgi:hypothetical protein